MSAEPAEDRVYLSIYRWPADLDVSQRTIAAQAAFEVDAFQAKRIAIAGCPTIVKVMPAGPKVREAIQTLAKVDVVAFAPRRDQILALPDPVRAKSLQPAVGAPRAMYGVAPWRGDEVGLLMDQVVLLVRGIIKRSTVHVEAPAPSQLQPDGLSPLVGRAIPGLGSGNPVGRELAGDRRLSGTPHQIIDLYRADGTRVRIDADKFSFGVLGKDMGLSDAVNADALALRLASEAPGALVDVGFKDFHPVVPLMSEGSSQIRPDGAGVIRTDRTPLFDFYSRWMFVLTRMATAKR